MNYTLVYVPKKEDEKIVISVDECTCYSNSTVLLEDFEKIKKIVDSNNLSSDIRPDFAL